MPAHSTPLISKTSFLAGVQCPKLLWTRINDPEALPPADEATQGLSDHGHEVPGSDYSDLAIQDGQAAARAFAAVELNDLSPAEREQIRSDLLAYCRLDTQAMVDLVEALSELIA